MERKGSCEVGKFSGGQREIEDLNVRKWPSQKQYSGTWAAFSKDDGEQCDWETNTENEWNDLTIHKK